MLIIIFLLIVLVLVTMCYCEGLNRHIKKLEDRINGLNRGNTDIFSHETIEYEEDPDPVQHGQK